MMACRAAYPGRSRDEDVLIFGVCWPVEGRAEPGAAADRGNGVGLPGR